MKYLKCQFFKLLSLLELKVHVKEKKLETQHIQKTIEKNNARSNGFSHKPSRQFKSLIDSTLHMFFGSIAISLYMLFGTTTKNSHKCSRKRFHITHVFLNYYQNLHKCLRKNDNVVTN
jgi:hypothetical protein